MPESAGKMYALAAVFAALAIVAVVLRFHARRLKKAKSSWDDYLILVALVSTIVNAICMIVGASRGDFGRHTLFDPRTHLDHWTHQTKIFFQLEYAMWLTQALNLGLTKLSVLAFYKRYIIQNLSLPQC